MSDLASHPHSQQPAALMDAAGCWTKLTASPKSLPPLDTSVLVRMETVGPVYDVAIYRGRDASGQHRWIHADIELAHKLITHWAVLREPEDVAE